MSRGDRPMPFEDLLPYYRGARYGMVPFYIRHRDNQEFSAEAREFIRMMDEWIEAAKATFRLKRDRASRPNAPASGPPGRPAGSG